MMQWSHQQQYLSAVYKDVNEYQAKVFLNLFDKSVSDISVGERLSDPVLAVSRWLCLLWHRYDAGSCWVRGPRVAGLTADTLWRWLIRLNPNSRRNGINLNLAVCYNTTSQHTAVGVEISEHFKINSNNSKILQVSTVEVLFIYNLTTWWSDNEWCVLYYFNQSMINDRLVSVAKYYYKIPEQRLKY